MPSPFTFRFGPTIRTLRRSQSPERGHAHDQIEDVNFVLSATSPLARSRKTVCTLSPFVLLNSHAHETGRTFSRSSELCTLSQTTNTTARSSSTETALATVAFTYIPAAGSTREKENGDPWSMTCARRPASHSMRVPREALATMSCRSAKSSTAKTKVAGKTEVVAAQEPGRLSDIERAHAERVARRKSGMTATDANCIPPEQRKHVTTRDYITGARAKRQRADGEGRRPCGALASEAAGLMRGRSMAGFQVLCRVWRGRRCRALLRAHSNFLVRRPPTESTESIMGESVAIGGRAGHGVGVRSVRRTSLAETRGMHVPIRHVHASGLQWHCQSASAPSST